MRYQLRQGGRCGLSYTAGRPIAGGQPRFSLWRALSTNVEMLKMAEAEGFEPPDRRKAGRLYSKQVHLPVLPRFQNLFFLRWRGTTPQVSRVRWIGLLPMYAGV